jgi:hypothetical protein
MIGVMAMTSEFRHGTIRATFVLTPERTRVVAAKVLASFLVGMGFGALGAGLGLGTGVAMIPRPRLRRADRLRRRPRRRERTRSLSRRRTGGRGDRARGEEEPATDRSEHAPRHPARRPARDGAIETPPRRRDALRDANGDGRPRRRPGRARLPAARRDRQLLRSDGSTGLREAASLLGAHARPRGRDCNRRPLLRPSRRQRPARPYSYTTARIAAFRHQCDSAPKRAEPRSLWTLPTRSSVPVIAFVGGADPQGSRHEPLRPEAALPRQPHRRLPTHRARLQHPRLRRRHHGWRPKLGIPRGSAAGRVSRTVAGGVFVVG